MWSHDPQKLAKPYGATFLAEEADANNVYRLPEHSDTNNMPGINKFVDIVKYTTNLSNFILIKLQYLPYMYKYTHNVYARKMLSKSIALLQVI